MPTNTKKHKLFVAEPMENKEVTDVPGVGPALGKKLQDKGFDKANKLLGKFLLLEKNTEDFTKWLKDISGANAKQADACAEGLKEWCDNYL